YPLGGRNTAVTTGTAGPGKPAIDSSSSPDSKALQARGASALAGPVSKGYREEMEHFAYCVKLWDDKNVKKEERPWPRCHGKVAMADAIVALTANRAMRGHAGNGFRPERITF